ncbi:MAG: phosphohistidine phosphatase SixA [Verrucomicrobia bacterium]|nr:phosphohistidine phosphatase SixA [Verrucomicrobiota bacterium]MBV9657524.1 phosphohistidine phosphatase SixA [Verrucomicrobiota bacterium]
MLLYLLRHADAEEMKTTDAERGLTAKGRQQAEKVSRYCKRCGVRPDYILTSPFRRARETAVTVASALETPILVEPFLASGMTSDCARHELRSYLGCQSAFLVGHQPDLGELIAVLLGLATASSFPVPKASLTALEMRSLAPGAASLVFTLPPRMME